MLHIKGFRRKKNLCVALLLSEDTTESAKFLLFFWCEDAHLVNNRPHPQGEDLLDEAGSLVGEKDGCHSAVLGAPFAPDESSFFEVVDDHRDISARPEDFPSDFARAQRSQMVERLEHGELTRRQVSLSQTATHSRGDRFGATHEIDEHVQRALLFVGSAVFGWHGLPLRPIVQY